MTLYRCHLPCGISVRVQIQLYNPMACCCFMAKYFLEAEIKIVRWNVLEFKHLIADTWVSLSCCSGNIYFIAWYQTVYLWITISVDLSLFMSPTKKLQLCAVAEIRKICSKSTSIATSCELIPLSLSLLCLVLFGVRTAQNKGTSLQCRAVRVTLNAYPCYWWRSMARRRMELMHYCSVGVVV